MLRPALFLFILSLTAGPVAAQLSPPSAGSVADIDRALRRLTQHKRLLVIGAHPDDEDTQTLTYVSLALGGEAAYLSLTRGEGGQNAIGPELGVHLGIIRTEELLAARRIDGARQYFTRAFDFGFSKSAEETYRFWPHDSILADVIAVIRRFRPQVIVSVFSGTPRDGHGQHQVSGIVAREAFDLLSQEPGGPVKLYRRIIFDSAATTLTLPTGTLDPAVGLSYNQIAMLSRSQHRSQDFGRLLEIGPATARLTFVASRALGGAASAGGSPPPGDALFAGVDTTLPGLERFVRLVDSARALLSPSDPSRIVPLLVQALAELRRAGASVPPFIAAEKERVLQEALAAAAGVVVDARTDRAELVPGQTLRVTASLWRAGAPTLRHLKLEIVAPSSWTAACPQRSGDVGPGVLLTAPCDVSVAGNASLTQPYFLERPVQGGVYDWSGAPASLRGEPFEPPVLTARFTTEIAGATATLEREVTQRVNEPSGGGEQRRPLRVVPAVAVSANPSVLVWPLQTPRGREITVTLAQQDSVAAGGEVGLDLPTGWPQVPPAPYTLGTGAKRSVSFTVRPPANLGPGNYRIEPFARYQGRRYDRGLEVVSYPHIRPRQLVRPATVDVPAASIALPSLRRVGYVRGAADMVPEALRQVGVPVELLDAEALERADLSRFDAIVIGSRAYETEPALPPNNGRLLDYARAGGLLIVQYQQYEFVRGNFAPFRLEIGRPHDRVTDETALVRVLDPEARVVNAPNRIGPDDWAGWVQERGLYFSRTWDSTYTAVLEMSDPGGPPLRGGLLIAPLGRGTYVYTGLSFFRQLPAGVPGAYRLFANLLALRGQNVP